MRVLSSLIIILTLFLISACDYLAIDKCLDQGGRWDYEKQECIHAEQ